MVSYRVERQSTADREAVRASTQLAAAPAVRGGVLSRSGETGSTERQPECAPGSTQAWAGRVAAGGGGHAGGTGVRLGLDRTNF